MLLAIIITNIFISRGLQERRRKNEKRVNNNYTDTNICNSTSFSSATQKQKFQLKLFDVEKYEREMNGIWKIFFFFHPRLFLLYFWSVFNVKALTRIHVQDEFHPNIIFFFLFQWHFLKKHFSAKINSSPSSQISFFP